MRNHTQLENNDGFDRALDASLAKYAAVEPRTGLEERILANLRTAETLKPRAWRWRFVAAAAAIIVIAFAIVWRAENPAPPELVIHRPNAISASPDSGKQVVHRDPGIPRRPRKQNQNRVITTANPKLDQFPSPNPLSAEEIALTEYVRNFPKEAQLVAQAQQEFELETEKEMNNARSEREPSGSTQQER